MPPVINPGGPMQRALTPQQQRAPITIRSATQPAKPATGGHYVNLGGNVWRQIHAVGPGKWAPGPPAKPVAPAPARTATTKTTTTNQWSNPLYQPAATLSGKSLSDAATALTNATYDPVISQYQQQIANRTQQGAAAQQQAAGYFNQLGQYAQSAVDKANSIGADLNTTLQGIGQNAQSALTQFAQQAAPQALQSLEAQGLGGGATQQLASQLAGLQSTAAQEQQARQSYGATVSSAASQRAAGMLGAYALGGQAALGKIGEATQQALTPMETNLTSEQAKKAAAFGTNLQALRQQQFNNLVAQSGLNIKQATLQNTITQDVANRTSREKIAAGVQAGANARSKASINAAWARNQANITSREKAAAQKAAAKGSTGAGATKPLTLSENNSYWGTVAKGISAIGVARSQNYGWPAIRTELLTKLNDLQARAAVELWQYHYLSPGTAQQLHGSGVRGGTYNGKPIQVGSNPALTQFEQAASQQLGF